MSWLLILCFGSLISASILVVLGFAVYGATRNTVDLLRDRADLGIGVLAREVSSHLESARNQAGFVARALETGAVDSDDPDRVNSLLFGAMAADPAINAIAYIQDNGQAVLAERTDTLARLLRFDLSKDEASKGCPPLWQSEPDAHLDSTDLPSRLRLDDPDLPDPHLPGRCVPRNAGGGARSQDPVPVSGASSATGVLPIPSCSLARTGYWPTASWPLAIRACRWRSRCQRS